MSGAVVAAMVARARRRTADYFITAGATQADAAIAFVPRDRRIDRRVFKRMVEFGALREEGEGKYWLDAKRFSDFRKESLARVLGILAVAGFAAAGAMAVGG